MPACCSMHRRRTSDTDDLRKGLMSSTAPITILCRSVSVKRVSSTSRSWAWARSIPSRCFRAKPERRRSLIAWGQRRSLVVSVR